MFIDMPLADRGQPARAAATVAAVDGCYRVRASGEDESAVIGRAAKTFRLNAIT